MIDTRTIEELTAALLDEDEDARYDAARAMARMGRPILAPAVEWAEDPRPRMREMACFILGQVGYIDPEDPQRLIRFQEGIPTLLRLLKEDGDEEVRASAAAALGHQAVPSSLPFLVQAASDPSSQVRFDAAIALGSFYDSTWNEESLPYKPEVTAALLRLMDDEDENVRDWAAFGIQQGGHDTPEVRARLWQALDDPHLTVRGEAADALAEFGDRSFLPRLQKMLLHDDALESCYFSAAEKFGNPALLPAVLAAAERWKEQMEEGEELHFSIRSAIDSLSKLAEK